MDNTMSKEMTRSEAISHIEGIMDAPDDGWSDWTNSELKGLLQGEGIKVKVVDDPEEAPEPKKKANGKKGKGKGSKVRTSAGARLSEAEMAVKRSGAADSAWNSRTSEKVGLIPKAVREVLWPSDSAVNRNRYLREEVDDGHYMLVRIIEMYTGAARRGVVEDLKEAKILDDDGAALKGAKLVKAVSKFGIQDRGFTALALDPRDEVRHYPSRTREGDPLDSEQTDDDGAPLTLTAVAKKLDKKKQK
jgi:hypothetical protein